MNKLFNRIHVKILFIIKYIQEFKHHFPTGVIPVDTLKGTNFELVYKQSLGNKKWIKIAFIDSYTEVLGSSKKFSDRETAKVCSFQSDLETAQIWKICWFGNILAGLKTHH